jgi:hypothetical protein
VAAAAVKPDRLPQKCRSAMVITPSRPWPWVLTGGTIDKVMDVSVEPDIDHGAQVRAWFLID